METCSKSLVTYTGSTKMSKWVKITNSYSSFPPPRLLNSDGKPYTGDMIGWRGITVLIYLKDGNYTIGHWIVSGGGKRRQWVDEFEASWLTLNPKWAKYWMELPNPPEKKA